MRGKKMVVLLLGIQIRVVVFLYINYGNITSNEIRFLDVYCIIFYW